ncbi:Chemotaxis protein methyltransferase 1 [subsurface metagenome]
MVLPELVAYKRKQGERRLRLWSAGCARGEEPYSIAILLAEFLGDRRQDFNISIYATDISRQALQEAQAGVYSSKDIDGLPSAILKNYFTRYDKGYVVSSSIRQMVRFSYFDLTSTTRQPFVDVDCVFCCNVLIYLRSQL